MYRDYVDLTGVAASISKGLVIPVLRDIESMSIVEIEKGNSELVKRVRTIHSWLAKSLSDLNCRLYTVPRRKVDDGRFDGR